MSISFWTAPLSRTEKTIYETGSGFAHKRHAALINDCSKCHHFRPKDENALETTRCSACHQDSFNTGPSGTHIGLKAAYHQQCIECHQAEAKGPVDCKGCHLEHVARPQGPWSNSPIIQSPPQVTAEMPEVP